MPSTALRPSNRTSFGELSVSHRSETEYDDDKLADCPLLPPPGDVLPILPPTPIPPTQPYRRTSIASLSDTPIPVSKPRIPSSSSLATAHTLAQCIDKFNDDYGVRASGAAECIASLHHNDSAVFVALGSGLNQGAVWISLRGLRRNGAPVNEEDARFTEVESVTVVRASGISAVSQIHPSSDRDRSFRLLLYTPHRVPDLFHS